MPPLRVMFINAENLFTPGNKFYGKEYTSSEYDTKVNWIAEMIAMNQVHVVGLTEIGEDPNTAIQSIQDRIKAIDPNMDFSHRHIGAPGASSTKIRNAIISRYPIDDVGSLTSFDNSFNVDLFDDVNRTWNAVPGNKFSRPVCYGRITLPNNKKFFLYVVHLKSKRPKTSSRDGHNEAIGIARSAIQRNLEAAALRYYFDKELVNRYNVNKDIGTILIGDFNDTPGSVPLENIRGVFDGDTRPASTWSEADKKKLVNCARLHNRFAAYEDRLFSYVFNERFSLLDQAFISMHYTGRFKRMELYNDHVFRHNALSETTDVAQQWKSMVSDHGAFVVELNRML